jgi:Flp pilus assembly protein TadB
VLASVVLAAAAVVLWWPSAPVDRLARLRLTGHGPPPERTDRPARPVRTTPWWMSPWLSALVAVFAVTRVVPGPSGYLVGALAAVAVVVLLRSASSAAEVRRREQIQRDLPLAVDLLVSCVAAGRPPGRGLVAVAASVGGPLGEDLRTVASRLELGADPMVVWRDLAADETFTPLGRALARSARTGSSITVALSRCADDLRRERRAAADANARKVGVRASAPLGACFLPAFFLVGVLPTIIGSVRSITW